MDPPIHAYNQIYPALETQGLSYEEGLITLAFEARKVGVDLFSDHSPQGWDEEKIRMVSSIIGDLVYLGCTELNFFYTVAPFLASADEDMLKHAAAAFTFLATTRGDIQENERFRATNGEILNEMIERSNHLGLRPVVKALFAIYHEEQQIMTSLRIWQFPQRQQTTGPSQQSSLTIQGLPQAIIDLVMSHENGPFNPAFKAKAMQKLTQAIKIIKSTRDSL